MGVVTDMDERTYRALPGLSGTGVAKLLESPADYAYDLAHPTPSTGAQSLGTLVHAFVLGTYTDDTDPYAFEAPTLDPEIVVAPFNDFRGALARDWKKAAVAEGADAERVVSRTAHNSMLDDLAKKAEALEAKRVESHAKALVIADAVLAHPTARQILEAEGQSEVTVTGEHRGAPLKGRIDRLPANRLVVDLKTGRDVSPGAMSYAMGDYGYACQFAHYAALVESDLRPVVIAVRNERRPAVAVYRIEAATWDAAQRAVAEAWNRYADCIEADAWPDTAPDGITDIGLTSRALSALEAQITNAPGGAL